MNHPRLSACQVGRGLRDAPTRMGSIVVSAPLHRALADAREDGPTFAGSPTYFASSGRAAAVGCITYKEVISLI
jgi:hypothetical protein